MGDKRKTHGEKKKENLERELPTLFGTAASANNVFAGVSFLMQLYGFYEGVMEGEIELTGEAGEIWETICRVAKENFVDGFDGEKREEAVRIMMGLRRTVTAKMQVLTAYADRFSLYEYMLNRIEPRFKESFECPEDDAAAREILQYIFAEKDNMLINVRIQQMLSQLPVRMSRGKFEDLVRAGFENYMGMDTTALDEFVYRLESAAGLYEPEGMGDFKNFAESLAILQGKDWKNMEEQEWREIQEHFAAAAAELDRTTNCYYSLMELINPLCAWLLNYPYASAESAAKLEVFMPLLQTICEGVLAKEGKVLPEPVAALIKETEGTLEKYGVELQRLKGIFSGFDAETEKMVAALMLEKQYTCIKSSALLLGNSLFVDLEAEGGRTVDRACLKDAADVLTGKLLLALEQQQKMQNRAMIAAVLAQLPVFFNSHNEVMDYVRGSLAGCHETEEKAAGIALMRELMRA